MVFCYYRYMGTKHNRNPKERLLESREIDTETGCWLWTKSRGEKGYGQIWYKGKFVRTSRLSYEVFNGPIPDGMLVLHKCDNPPCFNPEHLEVGTQSKNIKDCVARGRWSSKPKDVCKKGHPKGKGMCPICFGEYKKAYYLANRERLLEKARKRDRRICKTTPNARLAL